jgi:hypothetical protein
MMKTRNRLPSSQQYEDEAVLLKKVKEWLEPQERDGIKVIRICDRYARGYSDLFICVRGQFVVAELKDNTGTASQHQLDFIDEMIACGAIGGVCRSVKDVADLVEQAKESVNARRYKQADPDTLWSGLQSAT